MTPRDVVKISFQLPYAAPPVCEPIASATFALEGEIGRRSAAVTRNWVLPAPDANPAMLAMFRERDREPLRGMVPWAGEFAGKYLTHAASLLRLRPDPEVEHRLRRFVAELLACQDTDGYLGPWPRRHRLGANGPPPNCGGRTWDAWGHYHVLLGLLRWHALSGERAALDGARRIGDLFCATFLRSGRRFHDMGEHEMNLAPYHGLWLLYRQTGAVRYREMAEEIERDFETPPAGDYIRATLAGRQFHETPKPRWESLHPIQGLAEKHFVTGEPRCREAFERLWWSMLEGDRHNNGGFTSGERAQGDPYHRGGIETCCTVAWSAMSVDMLRLSGRSIVADELELSLLNSGLGLMTPSGRYVTYDTPMEGRRCASQRSLIFQARPGAEELNCCSVNGPRVLGLLGEWALMRRGDAIALNYYGPGALTFATPSDTPCRIEQETDYPLGPRVRLRVCLATPAAFPLELRIPHWSAHTRVTVNGHGIAPVKAGDYLRLDRRWQDGDAIELEFDLRPHYWVQGPGHIYRDWEAEWRVFGPCCSAAEPPQDVLQRIREMPDALRLGNVALAVHALRSAHGRLCFDPLPRPIPNADVVYAFTEIESDGADTLPIRFCAEYSVAVAINGQVVFSGEACGFDGDVSVRRWRADLPLRAGKNLICIAVTHFPAYWGNVGHSEWVLSMSRGEPRSRREAIPAGERCQVASIYRGPLLLAFDARFDDTGLETLPVLDARRWQERVVEPDSGTPPWLLIECADATGRPLRLCDFASAGATGLPYRTWFNVSGVSPSAFSPEHPLRSTRPDDH